MESLPWPNIGIGSGWLFVGLGVWLILTGRLVPRATLEDKAHEANEWRTEGRIKDQQIAALNQTISEKDRQLSHLGEVGRNILAVMEAIKRLSVKRDEVP